MINRYIALALGLLIATPLWASAEGGATLELTHNWVGYLAIGIFTFAYIFVILEEKIHLFLVSTYTSNNIQDNYLIHM